MTPIWPDFKKLTLDDQPIIKSLTAQFPPYSDFNFVSMWTYNVLDESEWSILNGNLVVKFQSYTSDDFFYSFLGTNKPLETVKTLLERSKELGLSDKLSLIPETSICQSEPASVGVEPAQPVNLLPTGQIPSGMLAGSAGTAPTDTDEPTLEGLSVTDDRDNFDYIFDVGAIATLAGSAFATHRNMAHRFFARAGIFDVKLVDLSQFDNVANFTNLFRTWEKSRGKSEEHEFKAVARLLRDSKYFEGLVSLGIYVNGQLEAWGVSEIVGNGYATAHYRKANADYPGIFTVLEQEMAKELITKDVKYLNSEQDLGIPGLRHSKEGWRPVAFLKKYTINV